MDFSAIPKFLLVLTILYAAGFVLALAIGMFGCDKTKSIDSSMAKIAAWEAFTWSMLPSLVYLATQLSPWFLSIFSNGMSSVFGYVGQVSDPQSFQYIGTIYAMTLAGFIVSARMLGTVKSQVCKPTLDELASFQENLMKKLREKEAEEKHDIAVIKPST
jgi:hypothetical protein